jgi:hypothetical protein
MTNARIFKAHTGSAPPGSSGLVSARIQPLNSHLKTYTLRLGLDNE